MQVAGQEFCEDVLARIRTHVADTPHLTRSALAREVCNWLDWRDHRGRAKEVNCRVALLKLARRGLVELPAAQPVSFARATQRVQPSWLAIQAPLAELGRVWLELVDGQQAELSSLWWSMMQEHHPLGAGPLCGAQLRYLVRCDAGVLGGLSFSAAAWRLAPRDALIGWHDAARRRGLSQVVANSRFLILPSVQVPNLASHVLGQALTGLGAHWHLRYGVTPVLVETFVDANWKGTCYRAANWLPIGQTTGRGRQDRTHSASGTPKDIWIYPLSPHWQAILQGQAGAAPVLIPTAPAQAAQDWAEQEFGGCVLPDARLQTRLLTMARDFYARPTASLPQACAQRAKTKAAYRFLDHDSTTMDALLQPHYRATLQRLRQQPVVLAVQDTTSLNYSAHPATEGLGYIGTHPEGPQGLELHCTLAFNPEGTPLGLMDVQCWARDPKDFGKKASRRQRPIEEKESGKWLQSYKAASAAQASCPDTLIVSVGDREADVYELFEHAQAQSGGAKLLVRAQQDRNLQHEQQRLWEKMHALQSNTVQVLQVPRQGKRAARQAQLEIRWSAVTLLAPKRLAGRPPIQAWAVLASERDAPEGVTPLKWLLLSTVEVGNEEQACQRLQWYAKRWGIEVYHRTLKSGCRVEQRQLGSAQRIEACLAIDLVVAWRIHHLTQLGREVPELPCTVYFEDEQWKALKTYETRKLPADNEVPSLRAMTRSVAALGGFLGRKADGEPGAQALWVGLQRLDGITLGWVAAMEVMGATHKRVSSREESG